jgi:hypothetical protein
MLEADSVCLLVYPQLIEASRCSLSVAMRTNYRIGARGEGDVSINIQRNSNMRLPPGLSCRSEMQCVE